MAYNNYNNKRTPRKNNKNGNYRASGRKKSKKKGTLVGIISAIIILVAGYFGYDYFGYDLLGQNAQEKTTQNAEQVYIEPAKITDEKLEYARCSLDSCQIPHDYYTIGYNKSTVQPNWVGYFLSKSRLLEQVSSRTEDFREDENCPLPRATLDDYRRSGYDRGHLAPAADFKFSKEAMSQTFFLSNMSPQLHGYNAGVWAKLESVVRRNAYEYGNLYVTTGPYFDKSKTHKTIGKNKIGVPDGYYKALLVYNDAEKKAIGFYIPHSDDESYNLAKYAMSIDDLEKLLDIDFFYNLPDDDENEIEKKHDISLWVMKEYQR